MIIFPLSCHSFLAINTPPCCPVTPVFHAGAINNVFLSISHYSFFSGKFRYPSSSSFHHVPRLTYLSLSYCIPDASVSIQFLRLLLLTVIQTSPSSGPTGTSTVLKLCVSLLVMCEIQIGIFTSSVF